MGRVHNGKVRSSRFARSQVALCCLLLVILAAAPAVSMEIVGRVPRILILYPYDERIAATTAAGEAVRTRLLEATTGKIDIFSEFLDLSRFPEETHVAGMARYLTDKYADRRPDVVIALGEESASFIVPNRETIAPGARIVVTGFSSSTARAMRLPSDVVGAFNEYDITKTLEMARSLQPKARHLFIIGGSADFDRAWLATARDDLRDLAKDYETTYLEDLTIDEFVERAAHLPPDSIVLALTIFRDHTGRNFIPREAIKQISATASAPVYGPYPTYIDYGIVGGNMVTFESLGLTVADLAVDAIAGKPIASVDVPQTYIADARQLERWGLSEDKLPPGTIQWFREKTLWEEHWVVILAIITVIAAQGVVIAGLLAERRRRRAAELESRVRLLELVHLNQSATAGALTASIAHELNQPLGAIRSNAEAAELLLRGERPDLKLIQQIVADILDDDQRAGDIILRLRGLLKKRSEIDWQEFDLNEVIHSAIRILHPEAERRNILVSSSGPTEELHVRADKVHIQQVILNLATNAMDAMLDVAATERRLVVQTRLTQESKVELSISDTGRGIPSEKLVGVFEAFYTTKPTGTGLGLPIARMIVEAYAGKIWADNNPEGGAVFRFVLPLARSR
ncbi:sensor histidine kinase [Rhizobium leguminosarum]|uniref:sensor histidine kinase n=2 Tax=Rhizobium/Agrobacterium group TaxID=227290 RepID=UPI0016203C91|nr:signal transduction histidine kinase [Rhizobium leguminosarum]MBB4528511.1 signal transduction histidine kinase [Rhizobium leguminosarum]MBB4539478.1 signal transduction histidine kinase [Rhizobium leguminosarum]MBB5652129.1 signal transduction histidine kinase [Rhizobium leguminosarum]MBB5677100.1 signal transduction histidine kinase [Rhizobium leguminosarum]